MTRSRADPDLESVVPKGSRLVAPARSSSIEDTTVRGVIGTVAGTSTIMTGRFHLREERCRPPPTTPEAVGGDAIGRGIDGEHVDVVGGVRDAVLLPHDRVLDDFACGGGVALELFEGAW